MMKKIAFVVAILCVASLASAYTLNGRKWFSSTSFHYNGSGAASCCLSASSMESTVKSGPNAWGSQINFGSNTSIVGAKQDGVNVVSWAKLGGTTLGVTHYIQTDTSQSQSCNGNTIYKFVEVDMRFNSGTKWMSNSGCSGGYDLNGVATHEFGHAYGLGHSSVQAATMYYAVSACDFSKSSLESDDRAGYSAIYKGCR